jgi:disulfide bond formation protein DsbB
MSATEPGSTRTGAVPAEVMVWLNLLALYAVSALLIAAYVLEFARDELPCPLCLLQRIALTGMAAGLIFNLRFGLNPRSYGLILLAASAGGIFAVRQILLHIAPGDPGYGTTVFGYHYYTWGAVVFAIAVVATGIVLLFDDQFERGGARRLGPAAVVAVGLALGLTIANVATTFLECGVHACPDNPVTFELLERPS